jgi:hypothetical protein
VLASPDAAWSWLAHGWELFPEARGDVVTWTYPSVEPWHLAYTTTVNAVEVVVDDEPVLRSGSPTRVDESEVRAKAAEQAQRLFRTMEELP